MGIYPIRLQDSPKRRPTARLRITARWICAGDPAASSFGFMTENSATDVVTRYNQALEARDFAAARSFLADNLIFEGPIDRFEKADDYVAAITGLYGMVKGVQHQATVGDGHEVAVFYILDTPMAKARVAEWYTVRAGKITHLRAYFDARPFSRG